MGEEKKVTANQGGIGRGCGLMMGSSSLVYPSKIENPYQMPADCPVRWRTSWEGVNPWEFMRGHGVGDNRWLTGYRDSVRVSRGAPLKGADISKVAAGTSRGMETRKKGFSGPQLSSW